MTLLVPWAIFPVALGAVALGLGLGLERLAGVRLSAPLLLPAGLAGATVIAGLTTSSAATARLTVPMLVALATGGYVLTTRSSVRLREPWAAMCATAAFLAVGAPVLASGEATFTGYVKLDDTATFLALTDRALDHGRDLGGLEPSSYEATLSVNLAHGYPTGALLPLGGGARLVDTDPAWVYHPYLAFLGAVLALALYALSADLVPSRPLRAVVAAVASQPALLYGFAMWGGVKELFAAATLALVAATVPLARDGHRGALVPACAGAALVLALSIGAALWIAPALAAVALFSRMRLRAAVVASSAVVVLGAPALAQAGQFFRDGNRTVFRADAELGNLVEPLGLTQILGIWPGGDFRDDPVEPRLTFVLLIAAAFAAVVGLAVAIRRRSLRLLAYVAMCAAGAAAVSALGSPWLEAKGLAVATPAVLILGLAGASHLIAGKWRVEGILLLALVAGGVVWSNALLARGAALAPRGELAELEHIGQRFSGLGPALMTEYQPYGVRHFLRGLDAEGASELRRRRIPLRNGSLAPKGTSPDIDALDTRSVLLYRTLVLRRLASGSRPPAPYRRVWTGRLYAVWLRSSRTPNVVMHVPLGDPHRPVAPAPCAAVLGTARVARASGGVLAAATPRELEPVYVLPSRARALCGKMLDWIEAVVPS